jgi:hypothetical protein
VPAPAAQAAEASLPPSAKNEAKEKRVAQKSIKKSTRKPKVERRAPAKQDMDDDDSTVASVDSDNAFSDDRGSYRRVDRHPDGRSDRSRRIVERWTERDYDVPDSRGGRRQVTVIRPDHGGGLFESLFGN